MPIRVLQDMKKYIEWYAEKEHTGKVTALRKILGRGLKKVRVEHALDEYCEGRVTLWKASEMAGLSLWEILEVIKEKEIPAPYTQEDVEEDIQVAREKIGGPREMIKTSVSSSTPLIYLTKIGKVKLLKEIFDKIYIPKEVFEEVIEMGRELNKEEVSPLEELIEEGFFEVKSALWHSDDVEALHKGGVEAISVGRELKIKTLLIDDKKGFGIAKEFGLHPISKTSVLFSSRWQRQQLRQYGLSPLRTTAVLLMFYRGGIIDYKELCDSLSGLSEEGYFMKAEVYDKLIEGAKELK